MIRHIVLFKLHPEFTFDDPVVQEAERSAEAVGAEVPELKEWTAGRNISDREVAYDYAVIGLLESAEALDRYMRHPFHQVAIQQWRAISHWVIADLVE